MVEGPGHLRPLGPGSDTSVSHLVALSPTIEVVGVVFPLHAEFQDPLGVFVKLGVSLL